MRCKQEIRNLQGVKVRPAYYGISQVKLILMENIRKVAAKVFFDSVDSGFVQDAQQQRLCTQEALVLQMKQELLRASMAEDDLNNQNV